MQNDCLICIGEHGPCDFKYGSLKCVQKLNKLNLHYVGSIEKETENLKKENTRLREIISQRKKMRKCSTEQINTLQYKIQSIERSLADSKKDNRKAMNKLKAKLSRRDETRKAYLSLVTDIKTEYIELKKKMAILKSEEKDFSVFVDGTKNELNPDGLSLNYIIETVNGIEISAYDIRNLVLTGCIIKDLKKLSDVLLSTRVKPEENIDILQKRWKARLDCCHPEPPTFEEVCKKVFDEYGIEGVVV